jgi:adenylate cyclase class 1
MAPEQFTFPQSLKRLTSLTAHPPPERTRTDITSLVDRIRAQCAAAGPAEARRMGDETALVLHWRAATSSDAELQVYYIGLLADLGPLAAPLAASLLAMTQGIDVAGVLDLFPGGFRLAVVNHLLLDDTGRYEALRPIAMTALPDLAALPPKEIAAQLQALRASGGVLAYPLSHALATGPFGTAVDAAITVQESLLQASRRPDDDLHTYVPALAMLDAPDLHLRLLPLLVTRDLGAQRALLDAIAAVAPRHDKRYVKALLPSLTHPDLRVRTAVVACLTQIMPDSIGRILAACFKRDPALQETITAALPLMPSEEAAFYIKATGEKPEAFAAMVFPLMAALDPPMARVSLAAAVPDAPQALIDAIPPSTSPKPDVQAALAGFTERPQKDDAAEKPKKKEKGFLGGLFSGDEGEAISIQFGGDMVLQSEHSGRRFSPIYEERTLRGTTFTDSLIESATFENCTFVDADFSGTIFHKTRFSGCSFTGCTMNGTRFFDCSLREITITCGNAEQTELTDCTCGLIDIQGTKLRGLHLFGGRLEALRVTACDLTDSRMEAVTLAGTELRHCSGTGLELLDCSIISSTVHACLFSDITITGPHGSCPCALSLQLRTHAARAMAGTTPPPPLPPQAGAKAKLAMDVWYGLWDIIRRAAAFMGNNARREHWCMQKLGAPRRDFVRLAPFFLHTEIFERSSEELEPLPLACRMGNYCPDYSTIEAARRHFPDATLPPRAPDPITFRALYTIGSVGTIAQSEASDLDYWLCYDPDDMPEVLVDGLAFKIEAIEQWADATFGLEVHFFTMDVERIRANNFGVSDAESSGTAQALLLKEEFYRSVLHVAGSLPMWWTTPAGSTDADYAQNMELLARAPWDAPFIDLGNLLRIPPQEFFGASLWQIVKALKSPFKSIMKFGLLEKYIAPDADSESPLLCERLKAGILSGAPRLDAVDPYVLMYKEVLLHYAQSGDKDSANLIRLSFFLKTKLGAKAALAVPTRREEAEGAQLAATMPAALQKSSEWPFQKLVSIGSSVNRFIVQTYMRVRDSQKHTDVSISPEDITKLGRKIFSTFSRRRHKIEHIPFVSLGGTRFRVLHFQAQAKKLGEPSSWEVQGAQEVATSQRLDLVNLRQGSDLAEHLVWLAANGISHKDIEIRGDPTISPVTVRDIQRLLNALLDFFPPKETFNTDIAEMLNPERIVRAFFILNLTKQRELARIAEVSVVYSTNWGELFCRTVSAEDNEVIDNPVQFLLNNVEQEFAEPPVLDYFVPDRSSSPQPRR